jgi:hypothetical protein
MINWDEDGRQRLCLKAIASLELTSNAAFREVILFMTIAGRICGHWCNGPYRHQSVCRCKYPANARHRFSTHSCHWQPTMCHAQPVLSGVCSASRKKVMVKVPSGLQLFFQDRNWHLPVSARKPFQEPTCDGSTADLLEAQPPSFSLNYRQRFKYFIFVVPPAFEPGANAL